MFVIKPKNAIDQLQAQEILSHCHVFIRMNMVEEGVIEVYDHPHGDEQELRLCEMAFQASFRQEGNLCPVCRAKIEETGEGDAICGHLTFTQFIGD